MTLRRSQSWRHRNTYCCLSFISWRLLFCALHKTTNVQTSCYRTFKELWFRSNGSLRCHHLTNKVRRTFQIRFPSRVSTPPYFPIVFKQTIVTGLAEGEQLVQITLHCIYTKKSIRSVENQVFNFPFSCSLWFV